MCNWLRIARSKRLRKQAKKALREMKEQEAATYAALDEAKDYVQRERDYMESKKGGKK